MQQGLHCLVSGRVQGVFFRAATRAEAARLGVTGWVRNLADGRVEVTAFGEREALEKLRLWLHSGPDRARVTEVASNPVEFQEYADFSVNY